jgi:hypothetical protein
MNLKKSLLACGMIAAIGGLIITMSVSSSAKNPRADRQHHGNAQRLVGTWFVTAVANVSGGPPLTLRALITCTGDGTVVETPQTALGVSTAHGAWRRIGKDQFAVTVVYLRRDDTGTQFLGTSKVRSTLTLDEATQELTGSFQTDVSDVDGNLVESFTGTAQAVKIEAEPLE